MSAFFAARFKTAILAASGEIFEDADLSVTRAESLLGYVFKYEFDGKYEGIDLGQLTLVDVDLSGADSVTNPHGTLRCNGVTAHPSIPNRSANGIWQLVETVASQAYGCMRGC